MPFIVEGTSESKEVSLQMDFMVWRREGIAIARN